MIVNPILNADAYKASHVSNPGMYPPGLLSFTHYLEARLEHLPRSAVRQPTDLDDVTVFGLQGLIREYFMHPIHKHDILEAIEFYADLGVQFDPEPWRYIVNSLGGKLPVEIWAPPEGTIVPRGNLLVKVKSTDERIPWMGSHLETAIVRLWYPMTVATVSRKARDIIYRFLELTADDPDAEIPYKLHDFGARGASSFESASIGGAAHLVNFLGSDTNPGALYAKKHYFAHAPARSIDAGEHSTVMSWGESFEVEMYRNLLRHVVKPGGIVACPIDTYDAYECVEKLWGDELRQEVIDSGATIVLRPDSGDPAEMCLAVAEIAAEKFGYRLNKRQYKVLNHIRIIQGDGMELDTISEPFAALKNRGFSATNLAVGMGAGLLQKWNRDSLRFAYKPCEQERSVPPSPIGRRIEPLAKRPKTDMSKASKSGDLDLIQIDGRFRTINRRDEKQDYSWYPSQLLPYFRNGEVIHDWSFDEVRARSWAEIRRLI